MAISPTTRRRWTTGGLAVGLLVGAAGVVVADHVTGQASGQSSPGTRAVAVTPGQLLVNQRISQAAVRRGNESLRLLDPIRPDLQRPGKVLGWRTGDLRDGAITTRKLSPGSVATESLADGAVTDAKVSQDVRDALAAARQHTPRWAQVRFDGTLLSQRGVASSAFTSAGRYRVNFAAPVAACALSVALVDEVQAHPDPAIVATLAPINSAPHSVEVLVRDGSAGGVVNHSFHITANC